MNDQLPTPPALVAPAQTSPAPAMQETPAATTAQSSEPDTYPSGIPRRLNLPSGNWVEFRDPDELRARDQRRIIDQIRDTEKTLSAGMDAAHGLACMLITAWSLPAPPPIQDPDQLDDLRMADYTRIITTVGPVADLLFGDTRSTTNAEVPGSPTGPAGA